MGAERVLQAALAVVAVAAPSIARAEDVAIIDVGPTDSGQARARIAAALTGAGLKPLAGNGVDDALAGVDVTPDAQQLATAMAEAQRAFGALDCAATTTAAQQAIGIASARQAAGLAVPDLSRAWTYVLLCADRAGDTRTAMRASAQLRLAGGSTDVPADIAAKYPEVDALLDRETYPLDIGADTAGATVWVDGELVGPAPAHVILHAGDHVIAAAVGDRRGFATGSVVKSQTQLVIATTKQRGPYPAVAAKIASYHGSAPSPADIAQILTSVHARVAIVRHSDSIEAWGHAGRAEPVIRLGGEDGAGSLDDLDHISKLVAERVTAWNDHAPDPDRELLTESNTSGRFQRDKSVEKEPAKWWVYGAIGGAAAIAIGALYLSETSTTSQRIEVHVP
ncbi:MAG TPA: hypothetical protein VGM90_12510 [Kofleriaceae bacterium]|jgi:hypothetical protein